MLALETNLEEEFNDHQRLQGSKEVENGDG